MTNQEMHQRRTRQTARQKKQRKRAAMGLAFFIICLCTVTAFAVWGNRRRNEGQQPGDGTSTDAVVQGSHGGPEGGGTLYNTNGDQTLSPETGEGITSGSGSGVYSRDGSEDGTNIASDMNEGISDSLGVSGIPVGDTGTSTTGVSGNASGTGTGEAFGESTETSPDRLRTALHRETVALQHELPAKEVPDMGALYGIYVHGKGWSDFFADNAYGMAPTDSYITGIRVTLHNQSEEMSGTIRYRVNLSGMGWLDWTANAGVSGDITGDMHLEAVAMELTGELAQYYDVLYSVLQNNEWTDWVKNGEEAGQSGVGLRMDGLKMSIVKRQEGQESYAGNIDPSRPMVALTYDDGPSGNATPRILAKLKEYGGRATFFMVGQKAEKNQDVIRQMVEQKCEVANHTYDHTLMNKVDPVELASQLERTNQLVADACGVTPVLMRPCGGVQNEAGMGVVGAISMPAVMWSIDTLDWKTRDPESTVKAVLDHVKDGDIVLMHDLYDTTAEASDTIIPALTERGFQLVTVSELATYRGGMLPGKSYGKFRP